MTRLYYPAKLIDKKQILISQRRQIHYMLDVLRLKADEEIFVFDGEGNEYRCRIQGISKELVSLCVKQRISSRLNRKISLSIACALTRQKGRFDDLVDKLSQLGVDRIIPMLCQRVVLRWDYGQKQRHQLRWQRIAQEACRQSGRNALPVIEPVTDINRILSFGGDYDLKLIPTPSEKRQNLANVLFKSQAERILVLIGPEGDFAQQELAGAKKAGFIPVLLCDLTLRVETAAIAVAALFKLNSQARISRAR